MAFAALAGFRLAGRSEAATVGALSRRWRQGGPSGSFGAEPFARRRLGLGAILRAQFRKRLVKFGIALAGGLGDGVPFQRLDLVDRYALAAGQYPRQPVLRDRVVLLGCLAQQRDRGSFVLRRAGTVEQRD